MAFDKISYSLSQKYTDETAQEFGGLKGASATVKEINEIKDENDKVIGKTVVFQWVNSSGATQEEEMDVYYGQDGEDGKDGKDGKNATINGFNILTLEAGDNIALDLDESTETITISASIQSGNISSSTIDNIWTGSKSDYDDMETHSESTLYFIEG